MTDDGIQIELTEAERDTLLHLLHMFIHERILDAVRGARREALCEAAGRAVRLAQLEDLAEEGVLRGDLERHAIDLTTWAMETHDTTKEHSQLIAEAQGEDLSTEDRERCIRELRGLTAIDLAHERICERVLDSIRAARAVQV